MNLTCFYSIIGIIIFTYALYIISLSQSVNHDLYSQFENYSFYTHEKHEELKPSVFALFEKYNYSLYISFEGLYYLNNWMIVGLKVSGNDDKNGALSLKLCPLINTELNIMPLLSKVGLHDHKISNKALELAIYDVNHSDDCGDFYQLLIKEHKKTLTRERVLIVMSTCNYIDVTLKSIASLMKSINALDKTQRGLVDVIVIDDYSIDDTVIRLRRLGFAVKEKDYATGLTASWNLGYQIAKEAGYKYIIFLNNDVIIPEKAVGAFLHDMFSTKRKNPPALLSPLSNRKGAGHNPTQDVLTVLYRNVNNDNLNQAPNQKLSGSLAQSDVDYVEHCQFADNVQEALLVKDNEDKEAQHRDLVINRYKNQVRFNGFFFGINIDLIAPAAYDENHLFDPSTVVVDQENRLLNAMFDNKIYPSLSKRTFIYHAKSITVGKSGYIADVGMVDMRDDLTFYHPELRASTKKREIDGVIPDPVIPVDHQTSKAFDTMNFLIESPHIAATTMICMAISNPDTNPTAGDIFTALEFARALEETYSLKAKFLYRGETWYTIEGCKVVIAFLDNYDPREAIVQPSFQHSAQKVIFVAWIRNWMHSFFSKPWLGHFHHLLVSSEYAADAFKYIKSFPVSCIIKCPPFWKYQNVRVNVSVSVLRLATNPFSFSKGRRISQLRSDYVFTGSYWSVPREIQKLDSSKLLGWKGKIFGSGWEKANLNDTFTANLQLNPALAYTAMPRVYRSTEIVVDDSNSVTRPWASLNSRVFDALACGRLVLTNNEIGSDETFKRLLPTYNSGENLSNELRYWLEHPRMRKKRASQLRHQVIKYHTYSVRAREFVDIMRDNGHVNIADKTNLESVPEPTESSSTARNISGDQCDTSPERALCVAIRTYAPAYRYLEQLLLSLALSFYTANPDSKIDPDKRGPPLRLFVMDTNGCGSDSFKNLIKRINDRFVRNFGYCIASAVTDPTPWGNCNHPSSMENATVTEEDNYYGYEATDLLLKYLVNDPERCEWVMITNGDNAYNRAFYRAIEPSLINPNLAMIAFDFVTHHPRGDDHDEYQQVVKVKIQRAYIDLGSAVIRSNVIRDNRINFMPQGRQTKDPFTRDYFFFERVKKAIGDTAIKLLHRILLFHQ